MGDNLVTHNLNLKPFPSYIPRTLRISILCCNMPSKKKDPNAPKRPLSAYFFFMGEKRPEVTAANPEYKIGDIGKALGQMWRELDASAKAPYEKKAEAAKKKYSEEMAAYKKA